MDAFGVVVRALVDGASAGEVEAFAEPVGPFASVGFAEQVQGGEVEQLGEPGAVGEGPDAVADTALDLAQGLFDGAGGVDPERVAGRCLGGDDRPVLVKPLDRGCQRPVVGAGVLLADGVVQGAPGSRGLHCVVQGAGDGV